MEVTADYRRIIDLVDEWRNTNAPIDALAITLAGLHLPPHRLGCNYMLMPIPLPPPGSNIRYERRLMSSDSEGTFGEIIMAYHSGLITLNEWRSLHTALHPTSEHCNNPSR